MPNGDRTGPEGKGSMTGRSLGHCSGSGTPGREDDAAPRRGFFGKKGSGRGAGRGKGVGRGRGFTAQKEDNS